jgi:hypothetical protein
MPIVAFWLLGVHGPPASATLLSAARGRSQRASAAGGPATTEADPTVIRLMTIIVRASLERSGGEPGLACLAPRFVTVLRGVEIEEASTGIAAAE